MPELPEVETVVRNLRLGEQGNLPLPGRKVQNVHVLWARSLAEPAVEVFTRRLIGQQVVDVGRRGKFIVIRLSEDYLLIHLRMSGDLKTIHHTGDSEKNEGLAIHDRMVIDFDEQVRMVFNDPRKFGRVWLVSDPNLVVNELGPEPLAEGFTPQILFNLITSRKRQIKALLLDQSVLAGLGNIYTDEALHLAGIHPARLSNTLSMGQVVNLWKAIRAVLNEGIRQNGASIDWVYRGGAFQNHFRVYQQNGKPCITCNTIIERILIGQRSTHFCPVCQPLETPSESD